MMQFDLDFEVPYSYILKFHSKVKALSESVMQERKLLNFSSDNDNLINKENTVTKRPELEFENLWSMMLNIATNVLNDTFYFPFSIYFHPCLIAIACISIAHSYISLAYEGVELIFDPLADPEPMNPINLILEKDDNTVANDNEASPNDSTKDNVQPTPRTVMQCLMEDDQFFTEQDIQEAKQEIDEMYELFRNHLTEFKRDMQA